MKKLKIALLAAVATLPLFQSCNDDAEEIYRAYVTVNATIADDYSFTLDNGETLYPGKKSVTYSTTDADGNSKDGKRALIIFGFQDKAQTGYDRSITLYDIGDILTKGVDTAQGTPDAEEKFGTEWIKAQWISLGDKWLDIGYRIDPEDTRKGHRISLVNNTGAEAPADMPQDYTYLEFRHKAESTTGGRNLYVQGIVSYKLEDLHPAVTGKKGLYIAVINPEGTTTYKKVDYQPK